MLMEGGFDSQEAEECRRVISKCIARIDAFREIYEERGGNDKDWNSILTLLSYNFHRSQAVPYLVKMGLTDCEIGSALDSLQNATIPDNMSPMDFLKETAKQVILRRKKK